MSTDTFKLIDISHLLQKGNKTKYNLVSETLVLLDVICGSTTGGLGLLGLYINENNVALINQILETLTEYCQVKGHSQMTSQSLQIRHALNMTREPNVTRESFLFGTHTPNFACFA